MNIKLIKNNIKNKQTYLTYAPGRIILSGEYSVMYGYPAIALTLENGIYIEVIKQQKPNGPILRANNLGIKTNIKPDPNGAGPKIFKLILQSLLYIYGEKIKTLIFNIYSTIPISAGLASSAALSIALVKAVNIFLYKKSTIKNTLSSVMKLENIFHGTASGLDHTAILLEGLISFKRNKKIYVIEKIYSRQILNFIIATNHELRRTKTAVRKINNKIKQYNKVYKNILLNISKITNKITKYLQNGEIEKIGYLFNINQKYLNILGVSTKSLNKMCNIAIENGAFGAKLTGAGFGGSIIAICNRNTNHIINKFKKAGYHAFSLTYKS